MLSIVLGLITHSLLVIFRWCQCLSYDSYNLWDMNMYRMIDNNNRRDQLPTYRRGGSEFSPSSLQGVIVSPQPQLSLPATAILLILISSYLYSKKDQHRHHYLTYSNTTNKICLVTLAHDSQGAGEATTLFSPFGPICLCYSVPNISYQLVCLSSSLPVCLLANLSFRLVNDQCLNLGCMSCRFWLSVVHSSVIDKTCAWREHHCGSWTSPLKTHGSHQMNDLK